MKEKSVGYWLASIGMAALAVAMIVYLGYRTLDFLQFTFKAEDSIFAWLGLFSTTLGALVWAAVFKWMAREGFQSAIALIMVVVSLLGELALAAGDMLLRVEERTGLEFTAGELRGLTYAAAGLAALHVIALFAFELRQEPAAEGRRHGPAMAFHEPAAQEDKILAAPPFVVGKSNGNGRKVL